MLVSLHQKKIIYIYIYVKELWVQIPLNIHAPLKFELPSLTNAERVSAPE